MCTVCTVFKHTTAGAALEKVLLPCDHVVRKWRRQAITWEITWRVRWCDLWIVPANFVDLLSSVSTSIWHMYVGVALSGTGCACGVRGRVLVVLWVINRFVNYEIMYMQVYICILIVFGSAASRYRSRSSSTFMHYRFRTFVTLGVVNKLRVYQIVRTVIVHLQGLPFTFVSI